MRNVFIPGKDNVEGVSTIGEWGRCDQIGLEEFKLKREDVNNGKTTISNQVTILIMVLSANMIPNQSMTRVLVNDKYRLYRFIL